jgi:hypothetical protein
MTGVRVRGNATREELAAVLAVLTRPVIPATDPYTQWRFVRLAVLRRDAATVTPPAVR